MRSAFELAKTPAALYFLFLLFTLGLGIITGIFPALYLSRFKPVEVLKDLSKLKLFSRTNLRKVLIVVQFTISLFLVFAVIIGFKQVKYQKSLDLGYNADHILSIELQEINYELFKNEILQQPGIEAVTATEYLPGTGVVYRDFVKCETLPDSTVVSHLTVDPDFINTMNIVLLSGKDFGANSESNPGNYAIINEAAIRHFEFKDLKEALEYSISIGNQTRIQIIGVIKDFIIQSADFEPDPLIIRVIPKRYDYAFVKIKSNQPENAIIASLETIWKKLNPEQLFRYMYFSEHLEAYQNAAMQIVKVLGFITFLTVLISILGLLGMVVFNNQNRVNEIGIRKVVGANTTEVLWVISKNFIIMMAIAVLIATPLTWFFGKMILQNAYHRVPLKAGFFITGIIFLLIIGVLTVLSQTWRAANRNPVDSLRYE
jgi:putative ABC transport system permease protein